MPPIQVPPLLPPPQQQQVPPNAAAIATKARQEHFQKVKAAEAARAAATQQQQAGGAKVQRRPSGGSATVKIPSTKPTKQPSTRESYLHHGSASTAPLIGQRLQDLLTSIDPNYTLDTEAEQQLLLMADDFLDKVTRQSVRLAQHRGSKTMDVQDVQLALSKQWGIVIPGLGAPTLKVTKPAGRVAAAGGTKRKTSDASSSAAGGASRAKKANTSAEATSTLKASAGGASSTGTSAAAATKAAGTSAAS
jgi:transcription initiation factor TFIID subunit 12